MISSYLQSEKRKYVIRQELRQTAHTDYVFPLSYMNGNRNLRLFDYISYLAPLYCPNHGVTKGEIPHLLYLEVYDLVTEGQKFIFL